MKNRIHYFPHCPRIRLDIKSTDFVFGKLLNPTNAVTFSMALFSWQPLLRILICRFIYSARLRSKLNGKKIQPYNPQKSFTDHRRREWSCFSPEKGVIITLPISVRMFLNVQQTFTAGQPGMSSIKITWRCDIFQPMVLSFLWAKQKWKFLRDPSYAALPLARAYRSLAACFGRHTWRAC